MLTRKYYKAIADIIATSDDKWTLVFKLCKYFKQDNAQFNEYKFNQVALPGLQEKEDKRQLQFKY